MADLIRVNIRIRTPFKPRIDFLREWIDTELYRRYRFDKDGVLFITNLLRNELIHESDCSFPCTTELQIMAALRYMGTSAHQIAIADFLQISVSQCFTKVDALLANKAPELIEFPTDVNAIRGLRSIIFLIPGIVGCLDCTHVIYSSRPFPLRSRRLAPSIAAPASYR